MASSAIAGLTLTDLQTRYQDGSLKLDYGVFSPTVDVSGNTINAALGAGNRTLSIHNIKTVCFYISTECFKQHNYHCCIF